MFKRDVWAIHGAMIPILNVNWQSLPDEYVLSERDADVLALIETEDLAVFTFDGLKRRTGLHPETSFQNPCQTGARGHSEERT